MKTIRILGFLILIYAPTFAQNPAVLLSNKSILKATGSAAPKQEQINLEDIDEWLCPSKLERGDREFGGNRHKVKSEVKLRLANNGTEVWADNTFRSSESKLDWSTTSGKWPKKVFDPLYGKKITKIASNQASRTSFVSSPAGAHLLLPGSDVAGTLNTLFKGVIISKGVLTVFGIPTPGQMESSIVAKPISTYTSGIL